MELSAAGVLDQAPAVLYVFDLETGSNLYSNRSIGGLLGYDPAALRDMGPRLMAQLLHANDVEVVRAHLTCMRGALDGDVHAVRYRMRHRDGSYRWLESLERPFARDARGHVSQLVGFVVDATSRIDAEAQLRRQEALYRLLTENARELICQHELDGRYVYVSPVIEALAGWSPDQLLGRHPAELLHQDDAAAFGEHLRANRGHTASLPVRCRFRRVDESYVWMEVTASPQFRAGVLSGFQTVSRDVTLQRELELQLDTARRLEAVAQLAGGLAHDFDNVLTVVRLNLDVLTAVSPDELARVREECIAMVERAQRLTRRLLALGRRRAPSVPQVTRVAGVVESFTSVLGPALRRDVKLDVTSRAAVALSASEIEQLVLNLALNARDAMSDGGPVTVEIAESEAGAVHDLGEAPESPHLRLTVRDTGHGIDPQDLSHVLEPFFTTKAEEQGTGLGLATVRQLVEDRAGGRLAIDTARGQGTAVHCYLPIVQARTGDA